MIEAHQKADATKKTKKKKESKQKSKKSNKIKSSKGNKKTVKKGVLLKFDSTGKAIKNPSNIVKNKKTKK